MRLPNQLNRWIATSKHHSSSSLIRRSISTQPAGPTASKPPTLEQQQEGGDRHSPKLYGVTYVPPLKITRQHTKRGDYGLYDGLKVRAGDNVSKSKHRTKRTWKPNVQRTTLWSEVLGQSIQLRVTSAALKSIDRMGGLDRYVLQMSEQRLGGMGIRIRELVIAAMQERVRLTKAFSRPIPADLAWRIPRWQDASERTSHAAVRTMVPSVDVSRVAVFPRMASPKPDGSIDPQILNDFHVRGKKGSQTSRRSTHPRR